ncbi:MAG TPA: hypothetical protein DEP23_11330 [Ruminococcaceae bacterium]|nr:hypothetical protein [Oscillospiraceae bacterium]
MQDILVGFVPNAMILVYQQLCIVIIENSPDVCNTLFLILMSGVKICDFLLCGFEVRGRAQDFLNRNICMKKRKTFVLRSSVVPC